VKPERAFLEFIREAGLPEPQTNVLVDGLLVDFFWPEHNLIVELDPYATHGSRRSFEEDRRRDAIHTLAGRRQLRITGQRFARDRTGIHAQLAALMTSR
jgi:very-short-patch-repair endonuclease